MTRIVVLGQPYWALRIARALDSSAPDIRATFVPSRSYLRLLLRSPSADRVILIRAGYRVGGTTLRGRLFDGYWSLLGRALPSAGRCHYWLGTDVLNTIEEARAGTLRLAAVAASRRDVHVADAPWLAAELETVGIVAATAPVPQPYRAPDVIAPLPAEFSVLTYISAARFDFYGGPTILDAARLLPGVRFDVVGRADDPTGSAPANVHWHGWVPDMSGFYDRATVVVRIPQHDGFGATVIEGLLHARHVIYTHEVPFVHKIDPAKTEALVGVLDELSTAHSAGRLEPNIDGRDYALATFAKADLAGHLLAILKVAT